MHLPKFRFAVLAGAVIGGLIPVLYFTVHPIQAFIAGSSRGMLLWPSSILLMATDGREHQSEQVLAVWKEEDAGA
jgi:hypothetical protein